MNEPGQGAIRLAVADDLAAIALLVESAYAKYIPLIGRKPAPMLDDYAALIRAERVRVLEIDDTMQGVVVLIPQRNAMLLDNVAVAPGWHGLGLGRSMIAFAERTASDIGYRSIRLYINEAMTENIALYLRLGYVETHRKEECGLRRIYLAKQLG